MPAPPEYVPYGEPWGVPYYEGTAYSGHMPYGYGGSTMGAYPYSPQMTREQELDFLRNQAEAIKEELDQIDNRIKELKT